MELEQNLNLTCRIRSNSNSNFKRPYLGNETTNLISAGAKILLSSRAFTYSFMKVASRHSFTLFRPLSVRKKHFFGVVQVAPGGALRSGFFLADNTMLILWVGGWVHFFLFLVSGYWKMNSVRMGGWDRDKKNNVLFCFFCCWKFQQQKSLWHGCVSWSDQTEQC